MQTNKSTDADTTVRDLRAKLQQLQQDYESEQVSKGCARVLLVFAHCLVRCQKRGFDIAADMTRQYKGMRDELLKKIGALEKTITDCKDQLGAALSCCATPVLRCCLLLWPRRRAEAGQGGDGAQEGFADRDEGRRDRRAEAQDGPDGSGVWPDAQGLFVCSFVGCLLCSSVFIADAVHLCTGHARQDERARCHHHRMVRHCQIACLTNPFVLLAGCVCREADKAQPVVRTFEDLRLVGKS
jgi:hypothetical protein